MSKYYKVEDVMMLFDERPYNWTDSEAEIQEQNDYDYYKSQIESLPTIEVSEDAISRRDLLEQIDKDSEGSPGYYGDTWQFIKTIENAPSVVPITEQSCDTCIHNKLEWFSEECDGCTKADSNYEPTTEQSSMVGEWIVYPLMDEGRVELECPKCGDTFIRAVDYKPHFCENFGAKMKGADDE